MEAIYKLPPFIKHFFMLVIALLFQIFFYNFMEISVYLTVSFYLFFIITLPVKIKKLILILVSFMFGWLLDIVIGTGGLYAMTTTFVAFIRPTILRLFFVHDERYRNSLPTSKEMGTIGFFVYTFIMVFLATLVFVGIEAIGYVSFWFMIYKVFLSTIVTIPFIYFAQLLFLNKKD